MLLISIESCCECSTLVQFWVCPWLTLIQSFLVQLIFQIVSKNNPNIFCTGLWCLHTETSSGKKIKESNAVYVVLLWWFFFHHGSDSFYMSWVTPFSWRTGLPSTIHYGLLQLWLSCQLFCKKSSLIELICKFCYRLDFMSCFVHFFIICLWIYSVRHVELFVMYVYEIFAWPQI